MQAFRFISNEALIRFAEPLDTSCFCCDKLSAPAELIALLHGRLAQLTRTIRIVIKRIPKAGGSLSLDPETKDLWKQGTVFSNVPPSRSCAQHLFEACCILHLLFRQITTHFFLQVLVLPCCLHCLLFLVSSSCPV